MSDDNDGKATAQALCGLDGKEIEAFVDELTKWEHRTNQQKAMGIFVQVMMGWAENYKKGASWYDLRNDATVRASAKIVEWLEKDSLIYHGKVAFPRI